MLVNRGWVGRQTKTWSHPADSKDIELLVIMSDMEKRGTFSPVNDHVSKKLLWLEYEAVMKAMGYDKCDADERPSYVLEAVGKNSDDCIFAFEKKSYHLNIYFSFLCY